MLFASPVSIQTVPLSLDLMFKDSTMIIGSPIKLQTVPGYLHRLVKYRILHLLEKAVTRLGIRIRFPYFSHIFSFKNRQHSTHGSRIFTSSLDDSTEKTSPFSICTDDSTEKLFLFLSA